MTTRGLGKNKVAVEDKPCVECGQTYNGTVLITQTGPEFRRTRACSEIRITLLDQGRYRRMIVGPDERTTAQ